MIITGHSIEEGIINDVRISSMGKKKYLNISFSIKKNTLNLPVFYFPLNDEQTIIDELCFLFSVKKLDDLKDKAVFCLVSLHSQHLLSFTNVDNFETFSMIARYKHDELWVKDIINQYPDITNSSFPIDKKANLSFLKKSLEHFETPTVISSHFLDKLNKVILMGKLQTNLNLNDNNYKKRKL